MSTTTETVPVVGEALVRQYAAQLMGKAGTHSAATAVILRAQPTWSGPEVLEVRSRDGIVAPILVRACVSSLAVRAAMQERSDGQYLVVLTDRSDADLGLGILSRCYDQRVVVPSMWSAVRDSFQAKQVDPSLARLSWVAEPLMATAPPGGWLPAPTGVLTRDHALSQLTGELLGLPASDLDPSTMLMWTLESSTSTLFRQQPDAVREGVIDWVRQSVGPVAALALRSSVQGHSVDAISIGLVADALWGENVSGAEVIAARTRLEQWTGVHDLDAVTARAFADAARGAAQRLSAQRNPAYATLLARATALFSDLRFDQGAAASTVLPAGYDDRLAAVAEAVRAAVTETEAGALARAEATFADLLRHDQAATDRSTVIARMAVRLARWLSLPPSPAPTNLTQAMLRQAREDAFVDWAAADVWVGATEPAVAAAWAAVFAAARARRDQHDRQFAALLADATSRDLLPDDLVPVESVIATVLAPLAAAGNRLLVVVVDGMSTAVAAEITDEALRAGWFEAVPQADARRTATLAVLPTLTRFSRTSLFTGALAAGGQSEERAGFAALTSGQVFHKADLQGAAGQALPGPVLEAIASNARMTAVVLNTVDDALSKADPGGTDWTLDGIQHLRPLLEQAARAGRTVVLISDHGHVVERGGEFRPVDGAEARWRPAGSAPVDPEREVALSGRRVLAPGGAIVSAVDEALRYATKQAGYHGGASAAEAVIPVIVLSRTPDDLRAAGWVPAAPQAPAWWNDALAAGTSAIPVTVSAPAPKRPAPAAPGQGLLDMDIPDDVPATTGPSLVDELLASPIYQAQKARAGARGADDATVSAAVDVLLTHAGRVHRDTLAAAAGIPTMRIPTTLTALRRQLNVEGYDVLYVDVDQVTVVLDVPLLRQQFLEDL